MIYFTFLLLVLPNITIAQEVNPEAMLADIFKLAAGAPGIVGAIIGGVALCVWAIVLLSKAINTIADYYKAKKIREEDAYKEDQAAKLRQMEDQSRRERDNYLTSLSTIEEAWRSRLLKIVELIKADKTADVLMMATDDKKIEISNILYDSTKSPEFRASEVIRIMRRK